MTTRKSRYVIVEAERSLEVATERAEEAEAALREAAAVFDDYARQHDAKGTEAGDIKAVRNRQHAQRCRAALAGEGGKAGG